MDKKIVKKSHLTFLGDLGCVQMVRLIVKDAVFLWFYLLIKDSNNKNQDKTLVDCKLPVDESFN